MYYPILSQTNTEGSISLCKDSAKLYNYLVDYKRKSLQQ